MFEYQVEIAKPLSEVYAAFNNPDNMPRWVTGLQRTVPVSGEPGQVGSKTRQIYLERGKTVELIETITAHEPGKHFAGVLETPGSDVTLEVDFEDKGASTVIRMRTDYRSKSLAMRLLMPFFCRGIQKRQTGDLDRFGEMVEAGELTG